MPVFLFTDIEGSTEKWEKFRNEMEKALAVHDAILQKTIGAHGGRIISHTGDGVFAVFKNGEPLQCALEIQKNFAKENWGSPGEIRIRIALHSGDAEERGNNYFGPVINRTARILSAGWGGQILLTPETADSCQLPAQAGLRDLGVHLLKDLSLPQPIFELVHPDLPSQTFPPLRSLSSHPNNLHQQPTPFLGREKSLIELTEGLKKDSCRLLTVTGPGGMGKTRLSIQAGAELVDFFKNGVYFVPLAFLSSPEYLVGAIANSLQFSFYGQDDPKKQLFNYLRGKELLLILDNFEHLIGGALLVSEILSNTSHIKCLATSRERLNLQGEAILEVSGMEIPTAEEADAIENYPSIQLFTQNARRVSPGFILTSEEKEYVIQICELVEGMPLANHVGQPSPRKMKTS